MKKVYAANSPAEAHMLKGYLESEGIAAIVQGEDLFVIRGGIPLSPDTLPSVWVLNDADFYRARELLMAYDRREGPYAGTEEE